MSEDKKCYKTDVDKLVKRYVERLENHMQNKKKLMSADDTIKFLYDKGQYPYPKKMKLKKYNKTMNKLQIELVKMQYYLLKSGKKVIILFEGRDAAGKGGTIQRFMMNLNARHARISALDIPTEYEKGQWYFQRYVKNLPSSGEFVCSDRSWYNRAGVEKVMGFCTEDQYKVFMKEVVPFEKMLVQSDIILVKYWLSINQIEQLRRFRKRQTSPIRSWKLSENDINSIDKWDDYTDALKEIFEKTSHEDAPWYVVKTDDKKRGRIECIRHLLSLIDYPDKDEKLVNKVDNKIVIKINPSELNVKTFEKEVKPLISDKKLEKEIENVKEKIEENPDKK